MYERLAELMEEKQITAYKLAQATGITQATLSRWKSGKTSPSMETLQILAAYFKVSTDYLMGKSAFRNAREPSDYWTINDPYFDPNFDFGEIIREERVRQGITIEEMAQALGITPEDVSNCESGNLPIGRKLADQMATFLETDVSQLLFDYNRYPDEVPYEYHDKVSEWEELCKKVDIEAQRESSLLCSITSPTERKLIILARHLDQIPEEQRNRLIKNFEDTIDLYFDAMGIPKEDE